jgi:NAD(P) transhydrogenase subunit alpha
MSITVGFISEVSELEQRVALVPETTKKMIKAGWNVSMQAGAGANAGFIDAAYIDCQLESSAQAVLSNSDVFVCISAPSAETISMMKDGSVIVGMIAPFADQQRFELANKKNITIFSMELVPRTSRAQSMDALSSQASAAGYKAVLMAASSAPRFFPMLTTAAGTIRPSQVLVIGAGVAGLQAIATAKRLGAMVMGYDVRPETVEQIQSLGAKFLDLGVQAVGEGGYARDLTDEEKQQQQDALSDYLKKVDILITTAAVPGRPAPRLITEAMADNLKPGSVVVDLGAEGGGNVAMTEKGKTVNVAGVTYMGPINLAGTLGLHASEMYSRNVWNLLSLMNNDGEFEINWEDDILEGSNVTRDGQIVHAMVKPKENSGEVK